MSLRNFRTVAKQFGEYDAANNELIVRKGRKIYRFSCGDGVFRFTAPSRPEIVTHIADDATVLEFRRIIAMVVDSPRQYEHWYDND